MPGLSELPGDDPNNRTSYKIAIVTYGILLPSARCRDLMSVPLSALDRPSFYGVCRNLAVSLLDFQAQFLARCFAAPQFQDPVNSPEVSGG